MKSKVGSLLRVPKPIWVLGFVSLFTDLGSEIVHSLLPLMLVGTLGASALAVGLIEGAAEALVLITKVFSGYISDAFGKRKPLVLLGYGLAAVVKPIFPLADSVGAVVAARMLDRFGKGIRGAPRDALVSDFSPPEIRGASFGLRQSMDTVGAVLGPLVAVGLMAVFMDDISTVLWFAVLPGLVAVLLLVMFVKEPVHVIKSARLPISRKGVALLGSRYWLIVMVGGLFSLARFSEAFLILRGSQLGLANTFVPLILVAMSLFYTLVAYPAGVLSDRFGRKLLFLAGIVTLVGADLVLATAGSPIEVFVGAAMWGVHMGLTQGVLTAMIADESPAEYRGTAFGVFSLVCGVALLVASALAGLLWDRQGPQAAFLTGATVATVSLLAALFSLPKRRAA